MIQAKTGSVVGGISSSLWAQVIKTSFVYGIVEVNTGAGNAQTVGMHIVNTILQHCTKEITDLLAVEELVRSLTTKEINIILCVPTGSDIAIIIGGNGSVFVKRSDQYARLIDYEGSVSGEAVVGDIYILLSPTCTQSIAEQELFQLFDHLSPVEVAEKLTFLLQEKKVLAGCAALFIEIQQISSGETHPISASTQDDIGILDTQKRKFSIPSIIRNRIKNTRSLHAIYVYIRKQMKTPGFWITTILCIVFLVSIGMGIRRELTSQKSGRLTEVIKEAERTFDEGQALMELNAVKGRDRLMQAKKILDPVKDIVTDKTKEERYVTELYARISSILTSAMHIYEQEPTPFYDASLLKLGGTITTMGLSQDYLILGDKTQKALYVVSVSSKTGQIIGGGQGFDQIIAVDIQGDNGYVLTPDGIHIVSIKDKTIKQLVIKKSPEWGTVTHMVTFGGNIYLLDTKTSRIWKYIATEKGFSEIKEYLNPDSLPDLSRATGLAIDSSVWIGTIDGKIQRFSQGKEYTYVYKGVDPPFGSTLIVYTSDETKNIYVLDKINKRVVALDKEGIYLAQYSWTGNMQFDQLVVGEKQGKILLLGEGKLYSIDLK